MSNLVETPIMFNVSQSRPFRILNLTEIDAVADNIYSLEIEFDRGIPAVTDAQIQAMDIELYTDAERTQRLGANEEDVYLMTVEPIAGTNTAILHFNLNGVTVAADEAYYAKLVVKQGT